jgi:hypothetical protein
LTSAPITYAYGNNVTYQDGNVYYGDQPVATEEQYYDQANQIASAPPTANEEWLPLGVFSVATDQGASTDKVVQLALNKEGTIQGSLYDKLTDKTIAVEGAVDKQTQRVAMKPEGNQAIIFETGLNNLTMDQVPVLVHFDKNRTEQRALVRMTMPESATPK